jgi:hypothetical protein
VPRARRPPHHDVSRHFEVLDEVQRGDARHQLAARPVALPAIELEAVDERADQFAGAGVSSSSPAIVDVPCVFYHRLITVDSRRVQRVERHFGDTMVRACVRHQVPREPRCTSGPVDPERPWALLPSLWLGRRKVHIVLDDEFSSRLEAAADEVIVNCDGDARAAVAELLLVIEGLVDKVRTLREVASPRLSRRRRIVFGRST